MSRTCGINTGNKIPRHLGFKINMLHGKYPLDSAQWSTLVLEMHFQLIFKKESKGIYVDKNISDLHKTKDNIKI